MPESHRPDSVSIRLIQAKDWSIVRDVILEMYTDAPHALGGSLAEEEARTRQEWQQYAVKLADTARGCGYLAEDAAGTCGFVQGDAEYPLLPPGAVAVFRLWVAPRQRGTGLGRKLMRAVTEWAASWGAEQVALGVKQTNVAVLQFYEHLGWQDTGVRLPNPQNPGENTIIMSRRLTPESPSVTEA
ncbi:MAG TPA: GNAT family N-acetyltransferase [bacterium]|nr:GNAT family N-acetyltransferase [bacterium]